MVTRNSRVRDQNCLSPSTLSSRSGRTFVLDAPAPWGNAMNLDRCCILSERRCRWGTWTLKNLHSVASARTTFSLPGGDPGEGRKTYSIFITSPLLSYFQRFWQHKMLLTTVPDAEMMRTPSCRCTTPNLWGLERHVVKNSLTAGRPAHIYLWALALYLHIVLAIYLRVVPMTNFGLNYLHYST